MIDTSWVNSGSLAVASLLSQVMAKVLSEEEAEDASWSSMVDEQAGWGSLQRMPGRIEHPKGSNWGVVAEALEAATSSGSIIMSKCVKPVGWQETASAALRRMPGIQTILNL